MTCTGAYTVTRDDLPKGAIANSATVTGVGPGDVSVENEASYNVTIVHNPKMQFVKQVASPAAGTNWRAGDTITYSFHVENVGNIDANKVMGSDTRAGLSTLRCYEPAVSVNPDGSYTVTPFGGPEVPMGQTMKPGEFVDCLATYVATQADADRGYITNTATLTAEEADATPFPTETSSATTRTTLVGSQTLTKTTDVASYAAVGQTIGYSFAVRNTGPVTITAIAVADPLPGLSAISCPVTSLAPGAETTCTATYRIGQADLDRGSITNTATLTSRDLLGNQVPSASSSRTVTADQRPAMSLAKQALASSVSRAGETIDFSVTANNTGNVTLGGVVIGDPGSSISGCSVPLPATLAPGESVTCTVRYTVTQRDIDQGFATNQATLDAKTPTGADLPQRTASATVPANQNPLASLTKTPDKASVSAIGEQITYEFVATNTGNMTLFLTRITDPQDNLTALTCTPAMPATLAPGESLRCSAVHTVTLADLNLGSVPNQAHLTGERLGGDPLNPADDITADSDKTTVPAAQNPALSLTKSADRTSVAALSDEITYTFAITNSGNVTVHDIAVADPLTSSGMSAISCPTTTLDPGASVNCQATYRPTQLDLDRGYILNTATAQGLSPTGQLTERASGQARVGVDQRPSYTLTKTADHTLVSVAGERVLYTFIGRNTGNVSVFLVNLTDPLPGLEPLDCAPALPATLAPGATVICRAWYTVTQADLNGYALTNTATITGNDPLGNPIGPKQADETISTVVTSGLTITKTADKASVSRAGDQITYTIAARNTGNQTAENVRIDDALFPTPFDPAGPTPNALRCTNAGGEAWVNDGTRSVLPDETITCTATYTVTLSDMNLGKDTRTPGAPPPYDRIVNQATVSGLKPVDPNAPDADRTITPASAQAEVGIVKSPALAIAKTTPGNPSLVLGQGVDYQITVTNTGNVTLTDVQVADRLSGATALRCTDPTGTTTVSLPTNLDPGVVIVCRTTYTPNQADIDRGYVDNQASVVGTYADTTGTRDVPAAYAEHRVTGERTPASTVAKTATTSTVTAVGQRIDYRIVVRNTGNVTVQASVDDPLPGVAPSCQPALPGALAPGAEAVCTATYFVRQADIDAGAILNTVVLTAVGPEGTPRQTSRASATVLARSAPALKLTKTATLGDTNGNGKADEGETVTYTLTATNPGTVTLTGVVIDDPMLGQLVCDRGGPVSLAPGAVLQCTGSHVVTRAEGQYGTLTNTAQASGQPASCTADTAVGSGCAPQVASARVDVPTSAETVLADTGSPQWAVPMGIVGIGLIMMGGLLIGRRRHDREDDR